jgi:hypothetical protein
MTIRATPEMFSECKMALMFYKTFNEKFPLEEWLHLNYIALLTPHNKQILKQ